MIMLTIAFCSDAKQSNFAPTIFDHGISSTLPTMMPLLIPQGDRDLDFCRYVRMLLVSSFALAFVVMFFFKFHES